MISNTGTIPTLHGGNITLETITRKTDVGNRRTKIICTLGPACWSEENLGTLMDAGMNVARFNFSHGDHAGHNEVLQRLRKVAAQKARNIGTFIESPNSTGSWIPLIHSLSLTHTISLSLSTAILLDTKGPEIRSGFFEEGLKKLDLVKGETITLTTDYTFLGNPRKLACSYPALAKSVQIGQSILCADGSLVLTVLSTDIAAGEITCRIENNASIGERKNMNLPGVLVELPTFTEKDIEGTTVRIPF